MKVRGSKRLKTHISNQIKITLYHSSIPISCQQCDQFGHLQQIKLAYKFAKVCSNTIFQVLNKHPKLYQRCFKFCKISLNLLASQSKNVQRIFCFQHSSLFVNMISYDPCKDLHIFCSLFQRRKQAIQKEMF